MQQNNEQQSNEQNLFMQPNNEQDNEQDNLQQNNGQQSNENIRNQIEKLIDDAPILVNQTLQDYLKPKLREIVRAAGGELPENPNVIQVQEIKGKIEHLHKTIVEVLLEKDLVKTTNRDSSIWRMTWNENTDKLSRGNIIQEEIAQILLLVTNKLLDKVSGLEESMARMSGQIDVLQEQNVRLQGDISDLKQQSARDISDLKQQSAKDISDLKQQNKQILELLVRKLNVEEKIEEKKESWVGREERRRSDSRSSTEFMIEPKGI